MRICYDRLLGEDAFRPLPDTPNGIASGLAMNGKQWPNGSILRVRFLDGTVFQHDVVKRQALWWSEFASVEFRYVTTGPSDIRISFDPTTGAWSYIGTDAEYIAGDKPTMNLGFLDGGTPAHELGHCLGQLHEHANPAGGIQWNEAVVIAEMAGPPNYWNEAKTRHNILNKYGIDQANGTAFDPLSIMLYFFPASWTLNGVGANGNDVLSRVDKEFIASLYPGKQLPPLITAPTGPVIIDVGRPVRPHSTRRKRGEGPTRKR